MNPYSRTSKRSKKKLVWLLLSAAVLVLIGAGLWFLTLRKADTPVKQAASSQPAHQSVEPPKQEVSKPPLVNLQPTVDAWLAKQRADFGIVVYDPANKQIIAEHQPDKTYFAASLYKIFVAYLALVDFQNGAQNPNEVISGSFTKKQCVDKMIRESYSPCGEAMMADMGQTTLRTRVEAMGIKNTTFAGITTTAQDSALILQYILEQRDLNDTNTAFLKDAMRVQDAKFRKGLATGAPNATWETKVGWNETYNYHDIGIMTLPNKRQYVVAILSQNNGKSAPIADFAATMYTALQK